MSMTVPITDSALALISEEQPRVNNALPYSPVPSQEEGWKKAFCSIGQSGPGIIYCF